MARTHLPGRSPAAAVPSTKSVRSLLARAGALQPRRLAFAFLAVGLAVSAAGQVPAYASPPVTASVAAAGASSGRVAWAEHFDRPQLDWVDPFDHSREQLGAVYQVSAEPAGSFPATFLHARYDGTASKRPPAMHFGRAFQRGPVALERVRALEWRWRALRHPSVGNDAWEDMAAGVYVVMKTPSLFASGRGFKFGWLAKPGELGTHQHGLLQVPLRNDAASAAWKTERVDLCALYRKEFGPCEGEHVLYVGVVTDGDGSKSVAEADYADFSLETDP